MGDNDDDWDPSLTKDFIDDSDEDFESTKQSKSKSKKEKKAINLDLSFEGINPDYEAETTDKSFFEKVDALYNKQPSKKMSSQSRSTKELPLVDLSDITTWNEASRKLYPPEFMCVLEKKRARRIEKEKIRQAARDLKKLQEVQKTQDLPSRKRINKVTSDISDDDDFLNSPKTGAVSPCPNDLEQPIPPVRLNPTTQALVNDPVLESSDLFANHPKGQDYMEDDNGDLIPAIAPAITEETKEEEALSSDYDSDEEFDKWKRSRLDEQRNVRKKAREELIEKLQRETSAAKSTAKSINTAEEFARLHMAPTLTFDLKEADLFQREQSSNVTTIDKQDELQITKPEKMSEREALLFAVRAKKNKAQMERIHKSFLLMESNSRKKFDDSSSNTGLLPPREAGDSSSRLNFSNNLLGADSRPARTIRSLSAEDMLELEEKSKILGIPLQRLMSSASQLAKKNEKNASGSTIGFSQALFEDSLGFAQSNTILSPIDNQTDPSKIISTTPIFITPHLDNNDYIPLAPASGDPIKPTIFDSSAWEFAPSNASFHLANDSKMLRDSLGSNASIVSVPVVLPETDDRELANWGRNILTKKIFSKNPGSNVPQEKISEKPNIANASLIPPVEDDFLPTQLWDAGKPSIIEQIPAPIDIEATQLWNPADDIVISKPLVPQTVPSTTAPANNIIPPQLPSELPALAPNLNNTSSAGASVMTVPPVKDAVAKESSVIEATQPANLASLPLPKTSNEKKKPNMIKMLFEKIKATTKENTNEETTAEVSIESIRETFYTEQKVTMKQQKKIDALINKMRLKASLQELKKLERKKGGTGENADANEDSSSSLSDMDFDYDSDVASDSDDENITHLLSGKRNEKEGGKGGEKSVKKEGDREKDKKISKKEFTRIGKSFLDMEAGEESEDENTNPFNRIRIGGRKKAENSDGEEQSEDDNDSVVSDLMANDEDEAKIQLGLAGDDERVRRLHASFLEEQEDLILQAVRRGRRTEIDDSYFFYDDDMEDENMEGMSRRERLKRKEQRGGAVDDWDDLDSEESSDDNETDDENEMLYGNAGEELETLRKIKVEKRRLRRGMQLAKLIYEKMTEKHKNNKLSKKQLALLRRLAVKQGRETAAKGVLDDKKLRVVDWLHRQDEMMKIRKAELEKRRKSEKLLQDPNAPVEANVKVRTLEFKENYSSVGGNREANFSQKARIAVEKLLQKPNTFKRVSIDSVEGMEGVGGNGDASKRKRLSILGEITNNETNKENTVKGVFATAKDVMAGSKEYQKSIIHNKVKHITQQLPLVPEEDEDWCYSVVQTKEKTLEKSHWSRKGDKTKL